MTAADSSSLISFLEGETTPDVSLVREGLRLDTLWLPPPVKTELMSRTVVGATFDDLGRVAKIAPRIPFPLNL